MYVSELMGVCWIGPFVNVADWALEIVRAIAECADWVCM